MSYFNTIVKMRIVLLWYFTQIVNTILQNTNTRISCSHNNPGVLILFHIFVYIIK